MTSPAISAIALDTGTTSIKASLLDQHGVLKHLVVRPAPKITVNGGRYESDALAYAAAADQALGESLAQADGCNTFGLCSQRSSFLIWEKTSGRPLTPLISWQDSRGAPSCDALRAHEKSIRSLTGLPLAPYYFAPKLRSLLLDNPGWPARLDRGELLVGTLDTFLIWRWSRGKLHVTDVSMAARTLLMDIRLQQWSPALCDLFGIPEHILPQINSSAGMKLRLDSGLLLDASVGDQSAALYASVREDRAEALVNLGTGCFVVRCLSGKTLAAEQFATHGYLLALVYQDRRHRPHFAIEGTLNSIAPALAPYPVDECRAEDLAVDDIFCLAETSGLGAPYFAGNRFVACLPDPLHNELGVQFSRSVEHLSQRRIAVLLLEAIIFRVARILEDFHRESAIERVYLSGGLSELKCLQEGIARCAPFDIYLLRQSESSLQGAALLAAGMPQACCRDGEKLSAARDDNALSEKYRRWKDWLDALLESR
ncbi:MAG: FGGY family carbohydrate kinase [Pseudomonadota bacterium]